ncbi:MAG: hypothetical protein ACI9XO_000742 [Paraglaciecola sp.]
MEEILTTKASWGNLFIIAIGLLFFYFALKFFNRIVQRAAFLRVFQGLIQRVIRYLLLLYEMLVIIILGSVFILINPFYHGILLAVILLIGFSHIKNYVSGRMIKLANEIKKGSSLQTNKMEGIVVGMNRLGLNLKTKEGIHFIQYNELMSNGYTILAGEDIGGFYELKITAKEEDTKINHVTHVLDLLITAPYLDWHHKPEVMVNNQNPNDLEAKVLVREEAHVHELVALIKEWGYGCRIA